MHPTPIQWTEFATNPLLARLVGAVPGNTRGVGHYCEKISDGCTNCYSSKMQPRFGLPQFQKQRNGVVKPFLDPEVLAAVLRRRKPTKIFWCDMTDMFGDWVPNEWIAACFGVMAATPQHTHQILTKRAKRMREWFEWVAKRGEDGLALFPDDPAEWRIRQMLSVSARRAGVDVPSSHGGPWPLPNVHLGVSVENQEAADERIPELLQTPAAVRWVSAEPLLGPVDFNAIQIPGEREGLRFSALSEQHDDRFGTSPAQLDWIVIGGESGPRARPFELWWARGIIRECAGADVPVFMKQVGSCPRVPTDGTLESLPVRKTKMHVVGLRETFALKLEDGHGGDIAEFPEDLRVREFPLPSKETTTMSDPRTYAREMAERCARAVHGRV
jgi:protein gp37